MEYNGYPSWALWNVSLWVSNDERLYRLAQAAIERTSNRHEAAAYMLDVLREDHMSHLGPAALPCTPDEAVYTNHNLRYAMRGMERSPRKGLEL